MANTKTTHTNIPEELKNNILVKKYGIEGIKKVSFADILEEDDNGNIGEQDLFDMYLDAIGWTSYAEMVSAWNEYDELMSYNNYADMTDWLVSNYYELNEIDKDNIVKNIGIDIWFNVIIELIESNYGEDVSISSDVENEIAMGRVKVDYLVAHIYMNRPKLA